MCGHSGFDALKDGVRSKTLYPIGDVRVVLTGTHGASDRNQGVRMAVAVLQTKAMCQKVNYERPWRARLMQSWLPAFVWTTVGQTSQHPDDREELSDDETPNSAKSTWISDKF